MTTAITPAGTHAIDGKTVGAGGPACATSLDPADADRRAPGRPRSIRADEAIVEAALDLLAEGTTLEAMSIESIATRAGVGKATIYRRWPNKETLLADAVAALKGPLPELDGVSVRDDLLKLLRSIGAARASRAGRIIPCLIPELARNEELARRYHTLTEPRRELMRSVLRRGVDSGELRSDLDIDMMCAIMVGPMVSQSVLNWQPGVDLTKLPEQIVNTLFPGMQA